MVRVDIGMIASTKTTYRAPAKSWEANHPAVFRTLMLTRQYKPAAAPIAKIDHGFLRLHVSTSDCSAG